MPRLIGEEGMILELGLLSLLLTIQVVSLPLYSSQPAAAKTRNYFDNSLLGFAINELARMRHYHNTLNIQTEIQ
jgi:hypothetical protein